MLRISKKLRKVIEKGKVEGIPGIVRSVERLLFYSSEVQRYKKWVKSRVFSPECRFDLKNKLTEFDVLPTISIVMPVFDVEENWLRLCIDSVLAQVYENWELCIADDCSTKPHIRPLLEKYAESDPRIKLVFRDENGHISAASNSALELATGGFCALLDHDDELSPDALYWVAKEINDHPDVAMIYSDEDVIDHRGKRSYPRIKPDFSRDLLYSLNLVTHLSAYRTDIFKGIGGFRIGLEGSQDYDLALRFIEQIDERQICHIPKILYHWRAVPGSVAFSMDEKPYAYERARDAIRSHFERVGIEASVERTLYNANRVRYLLPKPLPSVSLVLISSGEASNVSTSNFWKSVTSYDNLNLIEVNASNETALALNSAVTAIESDLICFLDSAVVPESADWLHELVGFAVQPLIGAVGGKIVDNDDRVIAGGVIFGGDRLSNVAYEGFRDNWPDNMCRNTLIGNFSAVSGSCMILRTKLFRELGGYDASNFPNAFLNDDLCLRIRSKGLRIVLDPFVRFKHQKGKSLVMSHEPSETEKELFRRQWHETIENDPFYNPNFSTEDGRFSLKV